MHFKPAIGSWECLFCVCLVLACFAAKARAENEDFEAKVFEGQNGKSLQYRLLKPEHYDPQVAYPLVLFLHGAGERGKDNAAQLKHVVPIFDTAENRSKYPCFVVVPQCPVIYRWAEVSWAAETTEQPKDPSVPVALLVQLLESMRKEYHIDANRQYIMGISMGGFGAWDMITRYPEMFAAAVPICGGGDEKTASRIAQLPIWVFHGGSDTVVKTARSRNMVEAIKKAGGNPRYTEYPGVEHNSWDRASHEPELLPWLFAQKRSP